jgi:hypothetical protein
LAQTSKENELSFNSCGLSLDGHAQLWHFSGLTGSKGDDATGRPIANKVEPEKNKGVPDDKI